MNRPLQDLPCWQVTIRFSDMSTYRCKVFAASDTRALELGLQDARMGSEWGQFSAPMLDWKAEVISEATTN